MSQDVSVVSFWEQYFASLPETEREGCLIEEKHESWAFGDSQNMANELGGFVFRGKKTATAGLLWDEQAPDGAVPQAGGVRYNLTKRAWRVGRPKTADA